MGTNVRLMIRAFISMYTTCWSSRDKEGKISGEADGMYL